MRRRPLAGALLLISFASFIVALAIGLFGAIAAVFLYDQGRSKGNDLAVALIGLHSAGTFAFVVLFTYLWSRKAPVSWRAPVAALGACVAALLVNTILASSAYDQYFGVFFFAGWAAEAVSGMAAMLVCRRILSRVVIVDRSQPFIDS